MRYFLVYWLLRAVKTGSRLFYSYDWSWVGEVPSQPWGKYRLVAILNHTSLFEFLLAGGVPNSFLRRMSRHGIVPIAAKTIDRPLVGKFWKIIAGNVVPITRERDHTWEQVVDSIGPDSMVIILPEGRMKRANGLDQYGRPLVVRGGIADLLEAMPDGKILVAYSTGLHHIQAPGERLPRLFQKVTLRLEELDIPTYREARQREAEGMDTKIGFKKRVIADLTARRDRYCDPNRDEGLAPVEI